MELKAKIIVFFLCGLFMQVLSLNAQGQSDNTGWNWPEDRKTAEEKNALYTDLLEAEKYEEATGPLQWLLKNAPDLNESIYINGAKIYENLATSTNDPELKEKYIDSTLTMYDSRIKYFGREAYVLNRKAYTAFKLQYKDTDKYDDMYKLMDKTVELNGADLGYYNIPVYMTLAKKNYEMGNISEDQFLKDYDRLMDIVNKKIEAGERVEKLKEIRTELEEDLVATVTLSCDYIEENFYQQFKQNPDSIQLARKIMQYSYESACTAQPMFMDAIIAVYNDDPTGDMAKNIAEKKMDEDDIEGAIEYYHKAIEHYSEGEKKANIHMDLADIYIKKGQKDPARNHLLKAAEADPEESARAYTAIGNLYMGSYEECRKGENRVKDRAIFLAAYEMYQKAGNEDGMREAKKQFPSKENIFSYDMRVGDAVTVDCWVNETVTIRTRD